MAVAAEGVSAVLTPFSGPVLALSEFFEPSMANSCWSSRARRWRGCPESDSQMFCHM